MAMTSYLHQIRQLLHQHDIAVTQILLLNDYMNTASRQAFYCAIDGNYMQVMHLLLRKSVAAGVKKMMKIYRLRKWFSVQNLVQKVAQLYQRQRDINIIDTLDELRQFPDLGRLSTEDIAAHSWTVLDCEFYRQS